MFSSISWFNILVLLIIGLIVIGPERLPGMIKEDRKSTRLNSSHIL